MDKLDLIRRNSIEILNEEKLKKALNKKKPVVYCGYEVSGDIHIGHLVTINKLLDFKKAGFYVKVLFADYHTFLNRKGDWDFIHAEAKKWKKGFEALGLGGADFVLGSEFQRKKEYLDDVLSLSLYTTLHRALRSMQQVARDIEHAKVSQVIYPFMQIVDMKYLGVDVATSGIEQRKIHALATELMPKIKYDAPAFVHTPLISSLTGSGKMSSSEKQSFISISDSEEDIRKKINNSYCPTGDVAHNPILDILQLIIFPKVNEFLVTRSKQHGSDIVFKSFNEVKEIFLKGKLHPADLKASVGDDLVKMIKPIKKALK